MNTKREGSDTPHAGRQAGRITNQQMREEKPTERAMRERERERERERNRDEGKPHPKTNHPSPTQQQKTKDKSNIPNPKQQPTNQPTNTIDDKSAILSSFLLDLFRFFRSFVRSLLLVLFAHSFFGLFPHDTFRTLSSACFRRGGTNNHSVSLCIGIYVRRPHHR